MRGERHAVKLENTWGLVGTVKDLGFYMNYTGKPLEGFKEGTDVYDLDTF